ncbi:MAG: redoxin domain-containing protein, partial [Bacteroidales bacterium]|nr:redoxin domain-containing protein [Bacteroidales bacterium]
GKELLLLFYDPGCQDCKEQLEKARQAHNRQQKIFLVNVEKNQKLLDEWEWEECMEHFDLSSQPYLILYDKKGKVIRRYFFL